MQQNRFSPLKTWDEYVPSWKELGAFGRSKIVNSAILIPLIGYYILYGQEFQTFFDLSAGLDVAVRTGLAPIDWFLSLDRVNLFYFGLCSIAVAAVLFNLFCPSIVKDFKDYADYLARGIGEKSTHALAYTIGEIKKRPEHRWPWYQGWIARIEHDHGQFFQQAQDAASVDEIMRMRGDKLTPEIHQRTLNSAVQAVMLMHYSVNSWSAFSLRLTCSVFYWVGFFLVGASALQVFMLVVLTAFGA